MFLLRKYFFCFFGNNIKYPRIFISTSYHEDWFIAYSEDEVVAGMVDTIGSYSTSPFGNIKDLLIYESLVEIFETQKVLNLI